MCDQEMSSTKESKETSRKSSGETKRMLQNDQEKQRKEKIKTCIGEIAKELPPSSEHLDRKPSTLSIVSQAKEYIRKLKEQNQAYENNSAAEQQQEELKRLRELESKHLEQIKNLEETLKAYALEKVVKPKSSDDSSAAISLDRDSPNGRRRPKTINKLLEKERSDQFVAAQAEVQALDGTLSLLGSNFSHPSNNSSLGGGNTHPPSSLVLPVASSGISIMTVAPTILSVKSPSLGQTRNHQSNRSISTASVVGSGTSSRISSSASVVSYLDVMGNDFSDAINGLGNSILDNSQGNLVYSTCSGPVSSASSVLAAGSGSIVTAGDIVGLQHLQNAPGINSTGGIMGSLQGSDLSMIHHHQQSSGMTPLMNINQHQDGTCSVSALQTLASVATSSHMAGLGAGSLSGSQQVGTGMMGLPVGMGGGMTSVSLGQLQQQQQQPPIMTLSHADSSAAMSQDRKQVLFNGQILTITEQGIISSHQPGDTDCQTGLPSGLCPQPGLSLGGGSSLQQGALSMGGLMGQANFNTGALGGSGQLGSAHSSVIYTVNEQGQLVPLQAPMGSIQQTPSGLEFMTNSGLAGNGSNILTNFQNSAAGNSALMPTSIQHHPQSGFLTQPSIMSIAGGQGSNQPFTILPSNQMNQLQPQMIQGGSFLMTQQFPQQQQQQQQVLNLGSFGGMQVVNPFTGMILNNMGPALNGATVKLVGNELKLIQPGDASAGAQGPTHVVVDGSLIPISTNPQTIVPNPSPLTAIGQKGQTLPLTGNPILQFDPMNPNAAPILINGPATTLHVGPQILGSSPLYSPALSGAPGILHMASGNSIGSSLPFQFGSSGSMVVASTMVTGTVTTNVVSACISSPSVSTASKGGKVSLPALAPALSQTSPTMGSAAGSGFQAMLPASSQQFIISGSKVVATAKSNTAAAVMPKPSNNRKRSPSTARASPIVAADISSHFLQQQQQQAMLAVSGSVTMPSSAKYSGADKAQKSKSAKHNMAQQQQRQQQQQLHHHPEEDKKIGIVQKKDLLAEATATAGILMEGEHGSLNISGNISGNLSGSSGELQISLKQSPRDEEDDNVQLIIDENCVSGVSSTSPAHSSFSPNMMLSGAALSGGAGASVFSHDMSLGAATSQHLHIQPHSGGLTTPLVSPNISATSSAAGHKKQQQQSSALLNISTSQLLSPLSTNIFSTTSTSAVLTSSTNSELQIVAGPFRPEDVIAQLSGTVNADNKVSLSPDAGNKLGTLAAFSVSTSVPLSLNSTSPVQKLYIPIAPAPIKVSTISSGLAFAQDAPIFSFADSMGNAAIMSDKLGGKGKSRSKKAATSTDTVASLQLHSMDVTICGLQAVQVEMKKKPPTKKRKTKAELKHEKEEKERLAKEEDEKKRELEELDKKKKEEEEKRKGSSFGDEDSLMPILEMNDNEAVKEQILHSVSESKLLNTDGSHISLMDMVDKIEIFNSETVVESVFCNVSTSTDISIEINKNGDQVSNFNLMKELDDNALGDKMMKRDSSKKRKPDCNNSVAIKVENKRPRKTKDPQIKVSDNNIFNIHSIPSTPLGNSDIYDFVDDEDASDSFLQPPPTPTKLAQNKKLTSTKKIKANINTTGNMTPPVDVKPQIPDAKPNNFGISARSDLKAVTGSKIPSCHLINETLPESTMSGKPAITSAPAAVSTPLSVMVTSGPTTSALPSPSTSLLSMPALPKSPPLFSSTPAKPAQLLTAPVASNSISMASNTSCILESKSFAAVTSSNTPSSCMSKKDGSDTGLHSTLDESFSMEFPVMDFQTSPKLSETHDDHENSMGLPAETLADLFNHHSPGKMMLNSSPPMLQNGVLSPSDVDLPPLRTPAPAISHNHSDPVLMLDTRTSQDLLSSTSNTDKQSMLQMQTSNLESKSPVSSLVENISSSSSASSVSLPISSSSTLPPLSASLSMNSNNIGASCMNSSGGLQLMDTSSSGHGTSQLESQIPTLSSTSLDALSEMLPLKPITAELEAEDAMNNSCARHQQRQTPVQNQTLSHVPLSASEMGLGIPQPNAQQQSQKPLQQQTQSQRQSQPHQSQPHQSQPHQSQPHQSQPHQSQPHQSQPHQSQPHQSQPHQSQPHQSQPHQSQPHQSQPHHPPQSSPHNLRPPSASTTPLPSPKLHASPGSASNAGSVHSMSPAAQQQQHSCQKQQQQQQTAQMGANSLMDRVAVSSLSHPPQQSPSLSQLFPPPDTSPRSTNFTSPPSGSSMKLKHMSPSNLQGGQDQSSNFLNSQKGNSYPGSGQQQSKNQYSVDKIIEHPNSTNSVQARHANDSFNFTNIGSNVATTTAMPSSGTMPSSSNPSTSGFSFSLSSTNQHQQQQQSSCSASINTSNGSSSASLQPTLPPTGGHASHNASYLHPFFPPPPPMNLPSSTSSTAHHSLAMHPLGNMEIQHPTSRPSSGGSSATYGIGPSSLMTFGNQPKLDIPPISKSPTYNNTSNQSSSGNGNSAGGSTGGNTGKSPGAGSGSSSGNSGSSFSHSSSKQSMDSSSSRYQTSKSSAESIYQQQQKRPNTIQHPPTGMTHMDSMARLSSSAHNNSFFGMGFSSSSAASLSSASMPLRHLPDTRDIPSRSPYDYPPVHHPAMGFAHPHSQLSSGYGTHPSFARDCARLETSHHQQAQQQQQQSQQQQQQQQSPRKQTTPKKSSSSSSMGSSNNTTTTGGSSSSSSSSHRNSGSSSGASSTMNQDHGHSPASSSRVTASQHHSNQQNSGSGSSSTTSHSRGSGGGGSSGGGSGSSSSSSSAQKRKTTSSSSSSKKKSTASQHSGFPVDAMDASMSQNMFEPTFPYLNFQTLTQSMSPPAARPHQADTPFLSGMFNTQPRPISNSTAKTADMTASHFPLFPTRAQNSFFQPTGFGMNSMTSNHANATAGISPHSMAVPPHMSAFGLFGNEATGAPDNISSNKFLHTNPILPGGHQTMDHSLQHGHQAAASLYHSRPHSAQSHMMAAFYPHGFDTRSHMGQPFNSSMGPPPFHTPGLPPINFSMHDSH